MLLNFEYQHRAVRTVDFKRGIDRGQLIVVALEGNVNNRANDLRDFSVFVAHDMLGLSLFLEMNAINDYKHHQHKVYKVDREKVFPFECKHLVNSQTGECPFKPDDYE